MFGGALLADAVGLGKTFVSLALADRAGNAVAVVPASLRSQWERVARQLHVPLDIISHEGLSRGTRLPTASLVVVDEAHHFRNPNTKRYRALARGLGNAPVLLVTATPVVNRPADLLHLLRLVLPDDGLAILGVPSLERALERRDFRAVEHAVQALMVARSPRLVAAHLPEAKNTHVVKHPTMEKERFESVVGAIEQLQFPNVGDREAKDLMRLGLFARLGSSVPALRESLRRHLGYLDLAWRAAEQGEAISRGAARRINRELGELQMELGLPLNGETMIPRNPRTISEERARVLQVLCDIRRVDQDPKSDALVELLKHLGATKTIVFTTAVPTAKALARRLRWQRVAVVAGGRAAIATGPIGVERALALFAPEARGARHPGEGERVDTLIATDLVSEGLNLQDAEAVVHYDLPWTPLGLAQRVGRLARLGSRHSVVRVAWFAPPHVLDARLRLVERIVRKASDQLQLPVSATSVAGRAVVFNRSLELRERLVAQASTTQGSASHAFVSAPTSVAALEWRWDDRRLSLPEIVVLPLTESREHLLALVATTLNSPPADSCPEIRDATTSQLIGIVRRRLASLDRGSQEVLARRLRRRLLERAVRAARRRATREIMTLDRVLAALAAGVRFGALTELHGLSTADVKELDRWTDRWARKASSHPAVTLKALLIAVI